MTVKKLILYIYKKNIHRLINIALLLLVLAACNAALPTLSASIIDKGLIAKDSKVVLYYAIALLAVHLAIAIFSILVEHIRVKGYNSVQFDLNEIALSKLIRVKSSYYNTKSATEMYQQISDDVLAISGCFSSEIIVALVQVFVAVGLIPVLVNLSGKLTLLMLVAIPIKLIQSLLFSRAAYRIAKEMVDSKSRYSKWMSDVISGMFLIRNYGLGRYFNNLFQERQNKFLQSQYKNELFQEFNMRIEVVITEVIMTFGYVFAGYLIAGDEITIGGFIAYQTYSICVIEYLGQFLNIIYAYSVIRPSFERYTSLMNEPDEGIAGDVIVGTSYDIKIDSISFSYPNGAAIFNEFTVDIPWGTHIAIVGENGSGKTTLINLLLRVVEPDDGAILINGTKISTLNMDCYRKLFSVASQKPFLFNDTIKNNICLYQIIPDEKINYAIECAGLAELIKERGIDYVVGEDGCELSGGQRQMISLARTIIFDRPIIVLDETEANIDEKYISLFQNLMQNAFRDKTVIIITHRNDVLKFVDKVVQLKAPLRHSEV